MVLSSKLFELMVCLLVIKYLHVALSVLPESKANRTKLTRYLPLTDFLAPRLFVSLEA